MSLVAALEQTMARKAGGEGDWHCPASRGVNSCNKGKQTMLTCSLGAPCPFLSLCWARFASVLTLQDHHRGWFGALLRRPQGDRARQRGVRRAGARRSGDTWGRGGDTGRSVVRRGGDTRR